MKKILSISLMCFCLTCNAQDILVFHNGSTANGKVSEVTDSYVKFIYEGEEAINVIGRNSLQEVKFKSGRVQEMSEKVVVNGPEDWENVRVVYDKDEVRGMKSLGQIEKHSSGTWSFHISGGHFAEKTLKKIRQEAARRGGCIVLVLTQQSKSGGVFTDGHAQMTGEIYKY